MATLLPSTIFGTHLESYVNLLMQSALPSGGEGSKSMAPGPPNGMPHTMSVKSLGRRHPLSLASFLRQQMTCHAGCLCSPAHPGVRPESVTNLPESSCRFGKQASAAQYCFAGDLAVAEKFLDDSERLYGEPHPTRQCVRNSRRIVVKVQSPFPFTVHPLPSHIVCSALACLHINAHPETVF